MGMILYIQYQDDVDMLAPRAKSGRARGGRDPARRRDFKFTAEGAQTLLVCSAAAGFQHNWPGFITFRTEYRGKSGRL